MSSCMTSSKISPTFKNEIFKDGFKQKAGVVLELCLQIVQTPLALCLEQTEFMGDYEETVLKSVVFRHYLVSAY